MDPANVHAKFEVVALHIPEIGVLKKLDRPQGAWAYPGTAQIFWVPPIISGMGKATNLKFCTHILSVDRNKRPPQISNGLTENAGRENDGPSKLQGNELQTWQVYFESPD